MVLQDLPLKNGYLQGGDGGNANTYGGGGGGGAGLDGAIFNLGKLQLKNTTFADNSANGGSGGGSQSGGQGDGGAIFNAEKLSVVNSTFSQNSVTKGAGGSPTSGGTQGADGEALGSAIFNDASSNAFSGISDDYDLQISGSFDESALYSLGQNTLTLTISGKGTVSRADSDFNCDSDSGNCTDGLAEGSSVTLTAVADSDSTFEGWGGACTGTQPTCTLTLSGDTAVSVTFAAKPNLPELPDLNVLFRRNSFNGKVVYWQRTKKGLLP